VGGSEIIHELLGQTHLSPQIRLVENLLEIKKIKTVSVERQIAAYPFVANVYKGSLICKIMKELWPYSDGDRLFSIFNEFENFLTAIGKRGHFIHQFEVFLLGASILSPLFKQRQSVFKVSSVKKLIEVWLLSSMTHDFGYPIEVSEKILTTVSGLYEKFDLKHVSERFSSIKIEDILKKEDSLINFDFSDELDSRIKYSFSIQELIEEILKKNFRIKSTEIQKTILELKNEKDHGYVSASILFRSIMNNHKKIKSLTEIRKIKDFRTLKLSMAAVLGHNFYRYGEEWIKYIDFDLNPYAYILFLIDNIQDWNRNIIYTEKHPEYQLADIEIESKSLFVRYNVIRENWSDKEKDKFENDINVRNTLINCANKPKTKFKYKITVDYTASDSHKFEKKIEVSI
jgi:hypothetical protein